MSFDFPGSLGVVFDMDGVLIDSEPLWHEAEQEVFADAGLLLSAHDCLETTGVRIDAVVRHWRRQRPAWTPRFDDDVIVDRIVDGVVTRILARGEAMPGAIDAVVAVARARTCGLASSSPPAIIEAMLTRLGLRACFGTTRSAWGLARGKPDPEVYRLACGDLGCPPGRLVAVEDSQSGLRAAIAAGMGVVAVPDPRTPRPPAADDADAVLASLHGLSALLGLDGSPAQ